MEEFVRLSVCSGALTVSKAPSTLSVTIEQCNPGPLFPCGMCESDVKANQAALCCDTCDVWSHRKCLGMPLKEYYRLGKSDEEWHCFQCALPSPDDSFFDDPSTVNPDPPIDNDMRANPLIGNATACKTTYTGPGLVNSVIIDKLSAKGLNIVHLNTRSLLPKMDELRVLVSQTKLAAIGITETWLDDSVTDAELEIPGYCIVRRDRTREGGGVCLYVNSDIAFNHRTDLETNLESVWVELCLPKTRPILVGVCYRPPKQNNFFETLGQCLSTIDSFSKQECIILGDFNVDCSLAGKSNALKKTLSDFTSSFDLVQLIDNPTRITKGTSTILDLIMVSDKNNICSSGVLDYCVSDHLLVFCTRKCKRPPINQHRATKARSYKGYTKERFEYMLSQVDWQVVFDCTDVITAWSLFKSKLLGVIDVISPIKTIRIKQRSAPWITGELIFLINERDKLFRRFKKTKSSVYYDSYVKIRNSVQYKKVAAKSEYVKNKLEEFSNQPRKMWQILKNLGTSSSATKPSNIGLKIDNELCFDKYRVTNVFNNFFTTVATRLVEKLPACVGKYGKKHVIEFYQSKNVVPNSFCFSEVSVEEVHKILCNLNSSKATGLDQLSPRFIKDGAKLISSPLAHILNLSLISGLIPDDLKSARVTPLYKKSSKSEPGNYRPVSILSTLSKLFERVVYNQLHQHLSDHALLYEYQSGFRSTFSTETCLVHLTDYIKLEQDKGNYIGMVLLDLQKAFDTVDHNILLSKLEAIGLQVPAIEWFRSYLTGRQQVVDIGGTLSDPADISCGVPQGSILGPLLFLIYVNDITSSVRCKLLLYADDSALIVADKSPEVIQHRLSEELESIREWLIDNKLSLHLGKTESILFASKRRLNKTNSIQVLCDDKELACCSHVKYLGLTLDNSLDGEGIVDKIVKKSNAKVKFLYRQARNLSSETKKLLVSALIQCHYDYACTSWYSGLTKRTKQRLQVSQNKIIRFLLDAPARSHIGAEEHIRVNMLPVESRVMQLKLNLVFKILHGIAPKILSDQFSLIQNSHSVNTRSSATSLQIPRTGPFGASSFMFTGVKAWNSLPGHIQSKSNLVSFKSAVKCHLFNQLTHQESQPFIYF